MMEIKNKQVMKSNGFGLIQKHEKEIFRSFITDEKGLYKVWHLGIPDTSPEGWQVAIEGGVHGTLTLTLKDLQELEQITVMSFQECAGSPVFPDIPQRRVGNIVWEGVRLRDLLLQVGVGNNIKFIHSSGVDNGDFNGQHYESYDKDLPLEMALNDNVLLALKINGEPLSNSRGGPVRLIVPGYYGTNSTKWLNRLALAESRHNGDFTTRYYNDREVIDGAEVLTPVWEIKPNSLLVFPENGMHLPKEKQTLWGWAWGFHPISKVEVSLNAGLTWQDAEIESRDENSWQRFSFEWEPHVIGEFHIVIRASDREGNVQPLLGKRNQVYRSIIFVS